MYVFEKKDDKFHYIGITHSPVTQGVRNVKLERNPNPNDHRTAYVRPKTDSTNEKLQTRFTDWKFSENDRKTVKGIIKNNKKK